MFAPPWAGRSFFGRTEVTKGVFENMSEKGIRLTFLGGLGEIGMNATRFTGPEGSFLLDCGMAFPRSDLPVAEYLLPDMDELCATENLAGVVITHGHEDHIGAVPWLLKRKKVPIYGPPFALEIIKEKLSEHDLRDVRLIPVYPRQLLTLAGFELEFLRVTHSIPDALSVAIRTPHGTIVHSGDFRIDNDPLRGQPFQMEGFERLGDEGVALYLGDSTNAMVKGHSSSEKHDMTPVLEELIAHHTGRVIVTMFASNMHRVELLARIAKACGREVCLVGRSLSTYLKAALRCNEADLRPEACIQPSAVHRFPDDRVMMIVTGSQGEPRSALARLAAGTHPDLVVQDGDLIIFSSRIIPGNELDISTMCNGLTKAGALVVTVDDLPVHATGHAYRDELAEVISALRPKCVVPVHGEYRFLDAHARIAEELGFASLVAEDGDILELFKGKVKVASQVDLHPWFVQGSVVGTEDGMRIAERKKLFFNGAVFARLQLSADGRLKDLFLECPGLPDPKNDLKARLEDCIRMALGARDSERGKVPVDELVRRAIRAEARRDADLKPVVHVLVDTVK
jgi:ribonuclease J